MTEGVQVVIAEDEPIVAISLADQLTRLGHQVVGQAGNGREAVKLVKELRPELAILDIKMPEMDGIAAARVIHEEAPTAIIMLTAYGEDQLVEQASAAGAGAYLTKPVNDGALSRAIQVALRRFEELEEIRELRAWAEQQAGQLSILNAIITAANEAADLDTLLTRALEQLVAHTGVVGAECHLADEAGVLTLVAQHGLEPDFVAGSRGVRLPTGMELFGQAFARRAPVYVPDVAADRRYLRRELARAAGYRSLLCVPISSTGSGHRLARGEPLGAIMLYSREPRDFTAEEQALLMTAGNQLAVAIERARLFEVEREQRELAEARATYLRRVKHQAEARASELEELERLAETLNQAVELGDPLEPVPGIIMEAIGSPTAWITLVEESGGTRLAAARGLPPALEADERAAMRWANCACQRQLLNGKLTDPVTIMACERLQRARGDTGEVRYHTVVPIRVGDRPVGNLNLVTPADRTFSDDELRMLTTVADQIGVAVERVRLYEQIKAQRVEEQAALLRLSQGLLGATDTQTMMDLATRMAARAINVELAAIVLLEPDGEHYSARAGTGWPAQVLQQAQQVPLAVNPGLEHAVQAQTPVVIADESRDTRFEALPWVREAGVAASLIVPMLVAEEAIGSLIVNSRTARDWRDDEVRLLSLIANQTAQALERVRLHEQTQQRAEQLSTLNEIGRAVSTLGDVAEVLDVIYQQVRRSLPLDAFYICLYDAETEKVSFPLVYDNGQRYQEPATLLAEGSNLGRTIQTATPRLINRTPEALADLVQPRLPVGDTSKPSASLLFAPLVVGSRVIGAVSAQSYNPNTYTGEHLALLTGVAHQAAITIQNARLYEEARGRADALAAIAEVDGLVTAGGDLQSTLDTLARKITEAVGFDAVGVALFDEDRQELSFQTAFSTTSRFANALEKRKNIVTRLADSQALQQMLQEKQPILFDDPQNDPRVRGSLRLLAREVGIQTALSCPLLYAGKLIGRLDLYSAQPRHPSSEELRLLSTLADQTAVAVRNAHLFAETQQRLREISLLFEEIELYRDVFHSTVDGVMITDLETHILDVNPAFERITDFSRQEAIGQKPSLLKSRHSTPELYREMWDQILNEGAWQGELINTRKNGEEWDAFLSITTVKDEEGQPVAYVGITRDITATKNLRRELQSYTMRLENSYDATIEALSAALDARDRETEGHSRRVTEYTLATARALGLSGEALEDIRRGALLHDVGKIGISDTILLKPGELSEAEWREMRKHPTIGHNMLRGIRFLESALPIVLHHHERYDGTGYPEELSGGEIPLAARIFAVADAYDAMTSDRPYQAAMSHEEAVAELKRNASTQFDPQVVEAFLSVVECNNEE